MDTQIRGLHHVTAMTSSAEKKLSLFHRYIGFTYDKKNS